MIEYKIRSYLHNLLHKTGTLIVPVLLAFCFAAGYAMEIRSLKFSTQNGLSDNTVREIYQDKQGYIWFATFNGLSRYDGYNIVNYTPMLGEAPAEETQIRKLLEDKNGHLWLMLNNDMATCLNLQTNNFEDILPGRKDKRYRYIKEMREGSVWLWGESGVLIATTKDGKLSSEIIDINTTDLPSNNIWRVEEDMLGRVLISTDKGLYAYKDGKMSAIDKTRRYQWLQPVNDVMLMVADNGDIVKMDKSGKLDLLYKIEGIKTRNELPGTFVRNGKWYITSAKGGKAVDLRDYSISSINPADEIFAAKVITDNNGDVWLHNETGVLYYLQPDNEQMVPLHLIPQSMMGLIDMERYSITRDKQGRAWITTAGNGLFVFDPVTGKLDHFTTSGGNYQYIPTDNLLSVNVDRQNNIWVGSEHAGSVMIETNNDEVANLPILASNGMDVAVRMIKRTPDGKIIISMRDGNVYEYSSDLKSVQSVKKDAVIYDAVFDKTGNRWSATRGKGIFLNGSPISKDVLGTSSDDIFSLLSDSKGRLWVGSFGSGLDVVTPLGNGNYKTQNFLNRSYAERRVRVIFEDKAGNVWVGTNGGVYCFNPDKLLNGKDGGKLYDMSGGFLRSNEIHAISQDNKGRIWIGESGNGITILDFSENPTTPAVKHIGTESGLSHNNVQSFVKEGDDYIWVTTLYGASRVNVNTLGVESFVFQAAPTANVHTANSGVLLDDGRLLLGTNQGAYTVDLARISHSESNHEIMVSCFKINGEKHAFIPDGKIIKDKDGMYVIRLPHNSNSLDFELTTFDYKLPKTTKFRYKLEPVDKVWNEVTVENNISFKNLSPGDYTLIVEASGSDGLWNKKFQCKIIIEKPWWASWWARCLYVLLIIIGLILVFMVINRFNKLHNKVKVEEQLTDYKLEFFTNISHEFRTPLTLIQVSLEKLHDKLMSLKESHPGVSLAGLNLPLATLDKNSRRMSRLIDELLTFRKVEKNKLVLFPEPTEVISFLHEIYENFRDEALSKHLKFDFEANCDEYMMNVDRNALDKIANNLISNALKYTREKGKVIFSVNVKESEKLLEIKVIDNGVGIPAEKREQLFSRFMQSAMSRNSIGVGLHLTFGLVELHKGKISHADNPGGGSIFTVDIPTDLPPSEHKPQEGIGKPSFETIFKVEEGETSESTLPAADQKKRMLIIDDDADIRSFLSTEFQRYFVILTASDGKTGLEAARNNDVHIIICDVMMPDMSGFEVTRLLKEDFATSHIPIIQLTALSNDDCQIEGITSGADAYVTKPFNLKFLKTRVAKLIEQRENLFAKFSATPTLARPQLPMGDKDKEFADKLAEIAEKQLDNTEFTVDDFASEMAMGRTIFFRKVKGVTGYAPKEYLRVMRMKKAAEMLLSTDMTITEISYRVGISDPAYFNKCFKAQFGKAPSIYQKENTAPGEPMQQDKEE